jgi:drug/metabolite transporter (DMT)-like permease
MFAAAGEWLWLGQPLTLTESLYLAVILSGVALALSGPLHLNSHQRTAFLPGVLCSVVAGLGQGFGGVLSRQGEIAANQLNSSVPALQQAFQRCLGGLAFAFLLVLIVRFLLPHARRKLWIAERPRLLRFAFWLAAAAFFGPVFGVTCFQWSLLEIGNSAIVQAVVSTTPIALIPLAWWMERDRPSPRSIAGSLIAVSGVVLLCLLQKDRST